jgi:hypothetical protein
MRRRKKSKAPQEPMQLSMDFDGTSIMEDEPKETIEIDLQERKLFNELTGKSNSTKIVKVSIPVESTFDVSQGLREAKSIWEEQRTQIEVEFDCRHLELANEYVSSREPTIFEPQEAYLLGKGGLLNTAVFFNMLRCCMTLEAWSRQMEQQLGQPTIKSITFEAPRPNTAVRHLWDHLGMRPYVSGKIPGVCRFQSRYVTPILWVDRLNEPDIIRSFRAWTEYISDRLSSKLKTELVMLTMEVTSNLIKYGFDHGFYSVSIWPSGQIEILWSNPIDHLKDWPPDDTAIGLINSLQSQAGGGAGMTYIYDHLLPQYHGVLAINCKGNDLIVRSSGRYSLHSQSSHEREAFFPTSILFTLHLFCLGARDNS